jgi:cell division protein FtsB
MLQSFQNNKQFVFISAALIAVTLTMAYYISNLLFYGDNSYEVYSNLRYTKAKLQKDIKRLQLDNASLQKKYFELKNLEPEEL